MNAGEIKKIMIITDFGEGEHALSGSRYVFLRPLIAYQNAKRRHPTIVETHGRASLALGRASLALVRNLPSNFSLQGCSLTTVFQVESL